MKVVIEMPLLHYDRFVGRCSPASKEYALLKNGIIVRREKDNHYETNIRNTLQRGGGKRVA
jgi:hypothetical protein